MTNTRRKEIPGGKGDKLGCIGNYRDGRAADRRGRSIKTEMEKAGTKKLAGRFAAGLIRLAAFYLKFAIQARRRLIG